MAVPVLDRLADMFEGDVIPGLTTSIQVKVASVQDPVYTALRRVDEDMADIRYVESNLRVARPAGAGPSGIFVQSRGCVGTQRVPSFSWLRTFRSSMDP